MKKNLLILALVIGSTIMTACSSVAGSTTASSAATAFSVADSEVASSAATAESVADLEPSSSAATTTSVAEPVPEPEADYSETLFNTSVVHTVDILIEEDDWNELVAKAGDKTKYQADVVIDGETIPEVSISTKGNSSLHFVTNMGSSRYSLKLNFGKNSKGQTYHGLNKLSLNNIFLDPTYMKDYISYQCFREMDIKAPLVSFVWVTVNGQAQGLYQAVEDVSNSFLERNFDGKGVLYKPEDAELALGDSNSGEDSGFPTSTNPHGADFSYRGDEIDSYPDIFDNAETKSEDEDKQRVIAALKAMTDESTLETGLDTEEIIRYFAVHNYLLNYDSYTGPMLHNYYLYENDGRLSLLPWDYNLCFGRMLLLFDPAYDDEVTRIINTGIDSPLFRTTEEERPMWKWIMDNDIYKEAYHADLDRFLKEYQESGKFDAEVDRISEMILPYVQKDPTAFYSEEQFLEACRVMKELNACRSASIRKQLDGSLATVSDEQQESDWVDASGLSFADPEGDAE